MDRYTPPFLGRRRGWLLPMQIGCVLLIGLFGLLDPTLSLLTVAYMALVLAFLVPVKIWC